MDLTFNKNEDFHKTTLAELRQKLGRVAWGGGKDKLAKLHAQGKWSARERIDYLLDPKSRRLEIGALAGEDMYAEQGGCPSAGETVCCGGQRCYRKGRGLVSYDRKKKSEGPRNSDRKPFTHHLFGG
ncbi:MAG: hypothetical protein RLZZ463_1157 [Bacteroidota bacterium]